MDVDSSKFTDNESEYGGAIDNHLGWLSIKKSNFKDNSVKKHGGAIFNGGMLESLEDSSFENNQCLLKGGAIYTTKSSAMLFKKAISEYAPVNENRNGGRLWIFQIII